LLKIDVHTHILPENLPDYRKVPGGERFVRLEHPTSRSGRARMIVNGSLFREIESNSWSVEARLAGKPVEQWKIGDPVRLVVGVLDDDDETGWQAFWFEAVTDGQEGQVR